MLLTILTAYVVGGVVIGLPILAYFCAKDIPLTDEMALAVVLFYPIVLVALLIYSIVVAIKGLLAFIILYYLKERYSNT